MSAPVVQVAGTVNGVAVTCRQLEGTDLWQAAVPRSAGGQYRLELEICNAAGTCVSFRSLVLDGFPVIFHRGPWDLAQKNSLAYLNKEDLNRIEANSRTVAERLEAAGYGAAIVTQVWERRDFPSREQVDRVRGNIDHLGAVFYRPPAWREITYTNSLDYEQVNALEWDLAQLWLWLERWAEGLRYCGGAVCGEGG